jgi:hypothetical protein
MTARDRVYVLAKDPGCAQQKQAKPCRRFPFHTTMRQHLPPYARNPSCSRTLDACFRLIVALVIGNSAILARQTPTSGENSLQIVATAVSRSEDALAVARDFRFLPGDYVYLQFVIAGYAVETAPHSEVRKISLGYDVSPQDSKGVPLTQPAVGVIKDELSPEDKNWAPKRRVSFLLPSFIAAGEFHIHLTVKDLIGSTSTERDVPFHVGGVVVVPAPNLAVQDFQFLRNEDDNEPLDVPAYRPGDTVFARFNMTGFRLGEGNQYRLSYGVVVNRPDGKPYLNEPAAAELSNGAFYPVPFVPGNLSVTTSRASVRGQYVMVLTVHDLAGNQAYQMKRTFTIE